MDVPREVQVKFGLEAGSIYIIKKDGDVREHFFVVLNINPTSEEVVLLVCASTVHQREPDYLPRIENTFGIETIVHISAGESKIINKDSTFDCNRIYNPTVEQLCTSVEYTKIEYVGKIEEQILEKLRVATLLSPRLKKKYISLIKEDEA